MAITLIVLTVAFVFISFWEFGNFRLRLDAANKSQEELMRVMGAGEDPVKDTVILNENKETGLEYVKWRSLVLIERETLYRRYNTTHSILFTQMLTRYFGFLTGMMLAMVGAVFILGKLQEEMSDLSGEASSVKLSVKSASPGIILVVLGTALLITTMVMGSNIYVDDVNIYLRDKPQAAQQNKSAEAESKNDPNRNMPENLR